MTEKNAPKRQLQVGDRVVCNGNPQGTILRRYSSGMFEVGLMHGCRRVGVVCVDEAGLLQENT